MFQPKLEWFHLISYLYSFKNYPYSPHGRSLEISRGRGSEKPKSLKESIKLNWNFQRGGGGV